MQCQLCKMQCLYEFTSLQAHAQRKLWKRLYSTEPHCTPSLDRPRGLPADVPGRLSQRSKGELLYVSQITHSWTETDQTRSGFANAITMTNSSLSDAYPYYLPLGTDMPVGVRPSCSPCLKNTMTIFQAAASNSTQPVSRTYITAAQQINLACGPEYVPESVEYKASSARGRSADSRAALSPILVILLMVLAVLR